MLYKGSLFLFVVLTVACVAISAADIIIQAKQIQRNLIVVIVFYVVLAMVAIGFSWGRLISFKSSLQRIPKSYMPIREKDVPKKVYEEILDGFQETKAAKYLARPRVQDIQTVCWAPPGTPLFENVNFKKAVARTPAIVEKAAIARDVKYTRPPFAPIRQYIEHLMNEGIINASLGQFYLDGYELARFSRVPITQEQYMDIMKYLAAILRNMGYKAHEGDHKVDSDTRSTTCHSEIYNEEQVRYDIYQLLMMK